MMLSPNQFKSLFDETTSEELYTQPSIALNIQMSDILNANPATYHPSPELIGLLS